MIQDLAGTLARAIDRESAELQKISETVAAEIPRGGDAWSRKQELGHLIDSATNNHVRFVRASLEPEFRGTGYDQNGWVRLHAYTDLSWATLVEFWRQYNSLLVHLVRHIPAQRLGTSCFIGPAGPVTLAFLIEDYILHMQHHLDHILDREKITAYPGAAVGV
jgi:hypothetical protein